MAFSGSGVRVTGGHGGANCAMARPEPPLLRRCNQRERHGGCQAPAGETESVDRRSLQLGQAQVCTHRTFQRRS